MLLAIDPGIATGWATFHYPITPYDLRACGLGDPLMSNITSLVVECPQIYPGTRPKQANDLITLAMQAGGYVERFREVRDIQVVLPHKWKGSVPKDVHHARVWATLSHDEQEVVDKACKGVAPSKRHNILDAIGLGLWALKRLRP